MLLLWAGAQAVERLGGKRRRGLGRCQFKFDAINKDEALNKLKQPDKPPCRLSAKHKQARQFKHEPAVQADSWLQVPLHLTLKSPVIVAQGVLGNVVKSLDYILGTHLLGAVTELLCQQTQLDLFNPVANGDIQVSHAYLEVSETRGLPVPMALFYKKDDDSGQVYNRLMTTEPGAQLKQHRDGYLIDNSLFKTPLQLTTHGTIEDQSQRPTEAVGGVFSFEAIKTGTSLQSVLKLRQSVANQLKKAHGDNWWKVLNTDISLGKSKKDDYGWVELRAEKCEHKSTTVSDDKQELIVWLCSDLLLRDARLRPSTDVTDLQKEL
jgi:CRISPR-associated protein Csx10